MEILLDTNFIISCIKRKIGFISLANEIFDKKINFLLPLEVLEEIKKLSKRKGERIKDKISAKTALDLINKEKFEIIKLNEANVDKGIIKYLNKNKEIALASLDKDLRSKTKAKCLIIKNHSFLALE